MARVLIGLFLVASFFLVGVCLAEENENIFNMTGMWTGHASGYVEDTGFVDAEDVEDAVIMNVTEQKEHVFIGEIKIKKKDGTYLPSEKFAGVVEGDGKEFTILELGNGFSSGDILGQDEVKIAYVEQNPEGKDIIAVNHLFRTKESAS